MFFTLRISYPVISGVYNLQYSGHEHSHNVEEKLHKCQFNLIEELHLYNLELIKTGFSFSYVKYDAHTVFIWL